MKKSGAAKRPNISRFRQGSKRGGSNLANSLVALCRAMRLRFGYGFESCDANGPRNVQNTNVAKHRPIFLPPLLLVGSKELVLKAPKRGQFHAAIRVTRKRCDSCGQVALETRPVSLVAQCSATPATVAATPPCSATPFQTQISVRHLPARGGGRCDTKIFRGCSATPVLHLQNDIKSRKSAATRVARQGVPAIVCN